MKSEKKMLKVAKKWIAGGKEDKFILKLIKEGKITKYTNPNFLQKEFPKYFSEFTLQVIRNHLNELKRSNGLYCKFKEKFI